MTTLRMPVTVASRKGVSALAATAADQRVVLTSHGRTIAVVDSAERIDEDMRTVREAALAVLDAAGDLVSKRSKKFSLAEVCAKLDIDVETVAARAEFLAGSQAKV